MRTMRLKIAIVCLAMLLGSAASSSAQAVSLQFDNGLVTLNAQNAPIRTILAEWSRLGGTRFVNGDRIGGAPVTLELTALPERQALEILLRSVAGYVAMQREGASSGVSLLGGVIILPTSAAVRAPAPVTFGATTLQQRQDDVQNEQNPDDRQGQRIPPPVNPFSNPPATTANVPGLIRVVTPGSTAPFGTVSAPPAGTPPAAGTPQPARPPSGFQTLPGTSRPGEITPQPQQPQQQER